MHVFIMLLNFRWLPTVICQANKKLLINVALGFDSYLVMRHSSLGRELGCYFCNDIVAAGNSQRERPLDQQCTVTRPGLSNIAGALAVELMVALFHPENPENSKSIPHQIRGSVYEFTQMSLEVSKKFLPPYKLCNKLNASLQTPPFPLCTACAIPIISTYQENPWEFTKNVCAEPKILENISGVEQLLSSVDLDLCIDSDEDF
jgi:ubiquitin-like modifier-activating enzyme ATG7